MKAIHTSTPQVITVDKNPAYPKAIKELIAAKKLPEEVKLRQSKYPNNIVEQGHRAIKRLVKLGMGFGFFNAARRTIRGYEVMNMIHNQNVYRMIQVTLPCRGWKPRQSLTIGLHITLSAKEP